METIGKTLIRMLVPFLRNLKSRSNAMVGCATLESHTRLRNAYPSLAHQPAIPRDLALTATANEEAQYF